MQTTHKDRLMEAGSTTRRGALRAGGAAIAFGLAGCIAGSGDDGDYPSRDINVVNPFSPGGGTDRNARLYQEHLPRHLPNQVNMPIEYIEGGTGRVAYDHIWDQEPDGYTHLSGHASTMVQGQLLHDVDYDATQLTHFGSVDTIVRAWVGNQEFVQNYGDSFEDFLSDLDTEELTVSTAGVGTSVHIQLAILAERTGAFDLGDVHLLHHDGSAEMLTALLRGDADVCFISYASGAGTVEDDPDLEFVAVASPEPMFDMKTETEWGMPADVAQESANLNTAYYPWVGPPGIADEYPERVEIYRQAMADTWADEEFLAAAEEVNQPVNPVPGEEMSDRMAGLLSAMEEWIDVIQELESG